MNDITKHMLREIIKQTGFTSEWFWNHQRNLIKMLDIQEKCYLMDLILDGYVVRDKLADRFIPVKIKIEEALK